MNGHERVWAQIDLAAIRANMESMHSNIGGNVRMTGVLKTNAYGHGAVRIGQVLEKLPYVWGYATATFEEARELREGGLDKPVLILGYVFPYCYEDLARLDIRPATFRVDQLRQLGEAGERAGRKVKVHIAVDTGMGRIGIRPDEGGLDFVRQALATPGVEVEGMFTHFAKADMTGTEPTELQLSCFTSFARRIEQELGYRIPIVHASNSAGIIDYRDANLDMVRAGITLYGLWPSSEVSREPVPLAPVLSLYSHVVFVKDLRPGESVSYGGTFTAEHTMRVATIPVGYGDGYPRSLSNKGYVLIRGQKARILGRVCMDQMMVDVSDIPGAAEGDLVTLIGTDGDQTITMEELGDLSGRFNYELACDLNPRVPRIFVGE